MEVYRRWLFTSNGQLCQKGGLKGFKFTVMSYNILSQKLLQQHMYLYQHSPIDSLAWEHRIGGIIWEIRCHDVDILCLQELEESDFYSVFQPQLFNLGYMSIYKKKTQGKTDGCAIFFKKHAFSLKKCVAVEFRRSSCQLLNKDNVGLVVLLQPVNSEYEHLQFCVSTTHLLFNPKRGDIKLVQLRVLLAEIDKMAFKGVSPAGVSQYYPVILCGDFNCLPFSPLYDFIIKGNLCCMNMVAGNVSGQKEGLNKGPVMTSEDMDLSALGINRNSQYAELVTGHSHSFMGITSKIRQPLDGKLKNRTVPDLKLSDCVAAMVTGKNSHFAHDKENISVKSNEDMSFSHSFNFVSAYMHVATDGGQEVSTCHSKAKCTVDYIFYTQPKNDEICSEHEPGQASPTLALLGVYSLFSTKEMNVLGNLPNFAFPSDHMCLITQFAFCTL